MQIDAIEVFHVELPLKMPQQFPTGTFDTLQTVLVRLESDGVSGWGEAGPGNAPICGPEWAGGAFLTLRDWLAPAVVGQSVNSGDDLLRLLARFHGNRFAKAALDFAWWDLAARQQEQPLAKLLDGTAEAVEVGPTYDQMETIDDLLEAVTNAANAGFQRIGLKFRPGWDVQMVSFVRQELPVLPVHIDCEGALRLDHMEMLCRLDDFSLTMIEQPLAPDDLVGHAMVQEAVRTPLCLDEAVNTPEQADMALELKSCKWVKIDPGRVGGLTPALAIYKKCEEASVPCWVGMPLLTSLGERAHLALATKPNFTYPADHVPAAQMLVYDLAERVLPVLDNEGRRRVPMWSQPGIGADPDAGVLKEYTLASVKL